MTEANKYSALATTGMDKKKAPPMPLSFCVKQAVEVYLAQLSDHDVVDMYAMVLGEVERPLLETTLAHCGHNQTKAAKILGLSRSTLRKKLEQYKLS